MNLISEHEHRTMSRIDHALSVAVVATVVAGTIQSTLLLFWPDVTVKTAMVTVPIQFIMGTFSLVALLLRYRQSKLILKRYAKIKT